MPARPVEHILHHLSRLRFRNLFVIAGILFLVDLAIPDFIPFIDELLLGMLTLLFWSWRRPPAELLDVQHRGGGKAE